MVMELSSSSSASAGPSPQPQQLPSMSLGLVQAIQASFGAPDDPDYVFDIAASGDNDAMAVSLSTMAIKLYSPTTGQYFGDCLGHIAPITKMLFPDPLTPHTLCSSSIDGTLRFWDKRTCQQTGALTTGDPYREIYSFSFGGNLISAGAKAQVIFWDWRTGKKLASLVDCHTEDVTQVHFHPNKRNKVVTASVDGLMCVLDTRGQINDDEGLSNVMTVGTSVAKIGFHGISNDYMWCLTHIETLSIWSFEEGRKVADFGDTRSKASANWQKPPVDYLIDCHYSSANNGLWLVAGTTAGILGYFPLNYSIGHGHFIASPGLVGPVSAVLEGGHKGVVRTVWSPLNMGMGSAGSQNLFCWTGGEDGRLCSWCESSHSTRNQSWVSSRLIRKTFCWQKHRHQPY